jgi:hypothetical protein
MQPYWNINSSIFRWRTSEKGLNLTAGMANTILLGTNDLNLKQLLGNGRIYHVPPYQRDYSWKEEHWEDLWLDLEELKKEKNAQHYMGSILLKGEERPEHFVIIDGQQRIATLSILILAAIARLREMAGRDAEPAANEERAMILRGSFIGSKDPGSLTESSKLSLNLNDNDFYQGTIVQLERPASERSLSDSEKLLWGAFKYFKRKIDASFEGKTGQELADWVNHFVAVRLLFIQVSVQDELNAYMVFETLNARGLELTASDLIKNYLMSLVSRKGKGDLKHILTRWARVNEYIGAQRLPEFIRHYVNSVGPYVRQERLFRHIREDVKTAEDASRLIRQLEQASVCYRALWDAEDEFWLDYPRSAEYIRALVMFGVSQFKPLILAATRRLPPGDVVTVLRDCTTVSLRFNVVSRLGTHELEKRYNEAALQVENQEARAPSDIRATLLPVYVDDDQFRADFEVFRQPCTTQGKQLIRFLLCALERQHSQHDVSWRTTEATIEHILPDSLDEAWSKTFSEDEHARYVDRLGNYALLEPGKNKDLGQKPFDAKKRSFATSQYRLTQDIAHYDDWNKGAIAERQRKLANLALAVWRFP